MINYLNALMLPAGNDPGAVGQWLQQNGLPQSTAGIDPTTGLPMAQAQPANAPAYPPGTPIDPRTGQPMAHPAGPDAGLTGWDGVSDKMRYLAQNARYNRLSSAAARSVPGQSTSGMGGGGGGFGHLVHSIFGHGGGVGAQ